MTFGWIKLSALLCLTLVAAAPVSAPQGLSVEQLRALREADLRLAVIGHRLATANVTLCDRLAPAPGWALHAIDQYAPADRANARVVFGFTSPVAVEALVPGGAAAQAGVRPDEGLIGVAGRPLAAPPPSAKESSATRDAALATVAAQPPSAPLVLTLTNADGRRTVTLPASPGCRTDFELLLGPKMAANADGRVVQIGVRFLERYSDPEIAAVVAHELAHNILRHRERLEAAGVRWGLLSEFGRNRRLFRRTEEEADQLSVSLLRNAGYDPRGAVAFWRDHGGDVDGGFFRSRTHPSSKARAAAIEAEVARLPPPGGLAHRPPVIGSRDQPLS